MSVFDSEMILTAFIVTALWDIFLRLLSTGKLRLLGVEKMKWVRVLQPYFERHTLLSAALIAGFVGALSALIVIFTAPTKTQPYYFLYIVLISGLLGFPMIASNLFPILNETYYAGLPRYYSFATDAMSGAVVALTIKGLISARLLLEN